MPNIKQQKKRVRTAAAERLENLRYSSTVKTFTRRLQAAVGQGDAERIAEEHRTLVRWIDKAAARGALHRNAAARKKSQAAKLVAGSGSDS
jgi:small subunit ribosomal protein S20